MKDKNLISLFFDGASRRNPGEAGAGGVLIGLEEEIEVQFVRGIRHATNNQMKFLALWKGLEMALIRNVPRFVFF